MGRGSSSLAVHPRMDRMLPVQDHRIALHGGAYMITLADITWRPVDIVLIAVIAAVIAGAVILAVRRKKKGSSCCGDCCKCKNRCPS